MQTATLQASAHGKSRVRVAKVQRHGSHHDFTELTVQIELLGGTESSFESSDNSGVVATDTCRNHVYMLAKTHNMSSPEMFAIDLADVFIRSYVHVRAVKIGVEERAWRRYTASGEMHSHGFVLDGQGEGTCNIFQTGNNITLTSGLKG